MHKHNSNLKLMIKSKPVDDLTAVPPLGMDVKALTNCFRYYYNHTLGRSKECKATHYPYTALAYTLRDRLIERWKSTHFAYKDSDCKQTYYLSLEFLMGRALSNCMLNLDLNEDVQKSFYQLPVLWREISTRF